MKATDRFHGLLVRSRLDPETSPNGFWLQNLFNALLQDYTPPQCLAGHDMNSHVLFMLVFAVQMFERLGRRLGCRIDYLMAAVLLHNIDRISSLQTSRENDPDRSVVRAQVESRFQIETAGCPFPPSAVEAVWEAVRHHGEEYDESKGSQLQRRLQQLDMLSRLNCFCPIAAGAQHGGSEVFDFQSPWLRDMEPKARFEMDGHSIYTIQIGVVVKWYSWLPDEVRPLAKPFIEDYLAYLRAVGRLIAFTTKGPDKVEEDLRLALGDLYV